MKDKKERKIIWIASEYICAVYRCEVLRETEFKVMYRPVALLSPLWRNDLVFIESDQEVAWTYKLAASATEAEAWNRLADKRGLRLAHAQHKADKAHEAWCAACNELAVVQATTNALHELAAGKPGVAV